MRETDLALKKAKESLATKEKEQEIAYVNSQKTQQTEKTQQTNTGILQLQAQLDQAIAGLGEEASHRIRLEKALQVSLSMSLLFRGTFLYTGSILFLLEWFIRLTALVFFYHVH